ncbi:MAG: hypothetical protein Q8Q39_01055 [bacterium]|nr:hypothetical protein [bacterium]
MRNIALSCVFALVLTIGFAAAAQPADLVVVNAGTNSLDQISTRGRGSVTTLAFFTAQPWDVVVCDPMIYASTLNNTVEALNRSTGAVTSIPTGLGPQKMSHDPDCTRVYVPDGTGIRVIDTATNTVVAAESIDLVPNGGDGLSTITNGSRLAVGTGDRALLYSVGSPPVLLAEHIIGSRLHDVVFSPDGTKLYAVLASPIDGFDENGNFFPAGNVHVLGVPSLDLEATIHVGFTELENAALSEDGRLHITGINGDLMSFNTATDDPASLTTLQVGGQLHDIAIDGDRAYMTNPLQGLVHTVVFGRNDRIDGTITLQAGLPLGIAILPSQPKGKGGGKP